MSYQFPLDELGVLNRSLAATGDNQIATSDDGSDEWNTADPGYQAGLGYIMESHGWGFAAQVIVLQPSPTPPQDQDWDTAYPIPDDCAHIIWLKIQDDCGPPLNPPPVPCPPDWGRRQARPTLYDILGTPTGPVIVTNAFRSWNDVPPPPPGPGFGRGIVTLKYISNAGPLTDSTNGTPTLLLALQSFVMSFIYRGLHEDTGEADKMWADGERKLQLARTRYDQQKPKRQFFNSRMAASRRVRRPWPPAGIDSWSGSRTPG